MNTYPKYETILLNIEEEKAIVTLNRPDVHNAFNITLINDLYDVFDRLRGEESIRAVVLTGKGKSFCAGADLNWMKSIINYSYEQNFEESLKLAEMMYLIYSHPVPVIARVNGSAIGGGVGLMSACDIIIASEEAKFGLSEVRLGLVPAAISPFVIRRIGEANARELFLTGERIDTAKALNIALINYSVPPAALDDKVDEKLKLILNNSPNAVKVAKKMIFDVIPMPFGEVSKYTAEIISNLRLSAEGQEGMNAFLEKRPPKWSND